MAATLSSCATDLDVAIALADIAGPPALRHFRSGVLQIDNKRAEQGAFDPVTEADREVETAIREVLATARPDDGILGEEHRRITGSSGRTWVIDPIDGTRAFMCGLPTWGVLIALNDGNAPIIGVMDQPFTGERFIGVISDPPHSLYRRNSSETVLQTRPCASLAEAVMCSTAPDAFANDADAAAFASLSGKVRLTRFGTDCYGYAMLASGTVDLVVESGLNPYDIQAMIPIVEAAGGIATNWQGGDCAQGGQVIAAGDRELHALALAALKP